MRLYITTRIYCLADGTNVPLGTVVPEDQLAAAEAVSPDDIVTLDDDCLRELVVEKLPQLCTLARTALRAWANRHLVNVAPLPATLTFFH